MKNIYIKEHRENEAQSNKNFMLSILRKGVVQIETTIN